MKRLFLYALCFVALPVVECRSVLAGTVECEGFQVVSNELTPADAQAYCRYAVQERSKVEAFWGATWGKPIQISVSSSYRIARSLVPNRGNPGYIEMPLARVRDNGGALLHEIVHNYAPNGNRFLQEGIAVYLQDKLGGNPSFPNFGRSLHLLASAQVPAAPPLATLNNVRFPQPLGTVMHERAAYNLAGSFVRFLIEKYGLPPFRKLYETENYSEAYGNSLEILEREWRAHISQNA
jgi:hypothetical protein